MLFYCSRCIIILSLKNGWITMRRKTIDTIPVLSDAMKSILSAFSKSRSLPSGLVKRAGIVLLASQGELNQNIAKCIQSIGINHFIHTQPVQQWIADIIILNQYILWDSSFFHCYPKIIIFNHKLTFNFELIFRYCSHVHSNDISSISWTIQCSQWI